MTRLLRERHRLTIFTLGLVLPMAFAAGLMARRPVPIVGSVPPELAVTTGAFGTTVWTNDNLWAGKHIVTGLRRDAAGALAVELRSGDLVKADVLVYWLASQTQGGNRLPDQARLLGALLNPALLRLPEDLHGQHGHFILYSLADHEIVATSENVMVK